MMLTEIHQIEITSRYIGAYIHARPDTRVFYVGKGTEKRALKICRDNKHHTNIVKKYGIENILVGFIPCSSEDIAFELEKGLIKCLSQSGVKLVNRTNGGEGVSGLRHSPETLARLSAIKVGNKNAFGWSPTAEVRAKISAAGKGREPHNKGKIMSTKLRAKISASRKGKGIGRDVSAETRAKIGAGNSLALKGRKATPKHRANISTALKGKKFSAEHLANLRIAWKRRSASEEYREKLRSAWRKRKGEAT